MSEIHVPQLGEGLREVRIVELRRAPGDAIRRGDTLYVIETDKTTVELEAPDDGRLVEWRVAPGDVVPIGATIAITAADGKDARPLAGLAFATRLVPPRTRAYAIAKGLTDAEVDAIPSATGKLLPADIDAHLARRSVAADAGIGYSDHKIPAAQRALVYRLRRSATVVVPGTIAIEVPWSWLVTDRVDTEGARPTPFQVFGHAVAQVANEHAKFRSVMVGDDTLREYEHVNIGLALARPDDELITAVIKAAEQLTLADFVRACGQQMRAAIREGSQAAEDTQVLLTHLGETDVIDAVPTLVAPASSVLFLGAPRPESGRARVVMTFDHRLINGASAARFFEALLARLRPQ